jgi:hypothetical protein
MGKPGRGACLTQAVRRCGGIEHHRVRAPVSRTMPLNKAFDDDANLVSRDVEVTMNKRANIF